MGKEISKVIDSRNCKVVRQNERQKLILGRNMASWPKSKEEQGWGEKPGIGIILGGVQGRLSRFLTSERK